MYQLPFRLILSKPFDRLGANDSASKRQLDAPAGAPSAVLAGA
jgi:hypothetical protein